MPCFDEPMDASEHIDDLAAFVTASPSSFHAAAEVARRLTDAGYRTLDERDDWIGTLTGGDRVLVVRDGAVIALALPADASSVTPFRVLGAHTDSPGFVLKPEPLLSGGAWQQLGVEVYGGPILASWFDRELELAGRVVDAGGRSHLARTGPIARIPHLAIHLDRDTNTGFSPDRQRDTMPIVGVDGDPADLIGALAASAGLSADEVVGIDAITVDTQPPRRFGLDDTLFASGRLDNLSSTHAGVVALGAARPEGVIAVLATFDHEEVGSESRSGAAGPLLADVLERVVGRARRGTGPSSTVRSPARGACPRMRGTPFTRTAGTGTTRPCGPSRAAARC